MTNKLKAYQCPLTDVNMVSAGAGTGKTYNIQILALRCILKGIPIDKILVVTFTKLATAELQDRLRRILQNARRVCAFLVQSFPSGKPVGLSDFWEEVESKSQNAWIKEREIAQVLPCFGMTEQEDELPPAEEVEAIWGNLGGTLKALEAALRDFDNAPISTIHGFCSRVLRDNAFESGVRYGLEMRKSCRSLEKAILGEFCRKFCAGAKNSKRLFLVNSLKITPDSLMKEMKDVFANSGVAVNYGQDLQGQKLEEIEQEAAWDVPYQMACWKKEHSEEELIAFASKFGLLKMLEDILSENRIWNQLRLLGEKYHFLALPKELLNLNVNKLRAMGEYLAGNTAVEVPEEKAGDTLVSLETRYHRLVIQAAARAVQEGLEAAKLRDGFMTYDDLLLKLKEQLQTGANRKKLQQVIRDKFTCVMIDEFQDTDSNQSAIFNCLFEKGDESHVKFMIGDEKQAIYMFRGGDVQAYQAEKSKVDPTHQYTLSRNFRSTSDYIQALNCFREGHGNFFEPAKIPWEEIEPSKEMWLGDGQNEHIGSEELLSVCLVEDDIYDLLASEIEALASGALKKCKELSVTEGEKPSVQTEPIRYCDVAILVPSKRYADGIRRSLLTLGIPSVFMEGRTVFRTVEGGWMYTLLDAVNFPGDQSKAMLLLGGPLFHFSPLALELLRDVCLPEFQMYLKSLKELWETRNFYFMINSFLNDGISRMMPSLEELSRQVCGVVEKSSERRCLAFGEKWGISETGWKAVAAEFNALFQGVSEFGKKVAVSPAMLVAGHSADGLRSLSLLMQLAEILMNLSMAEHLGPLGLLSLLNEKLQKNSEKEFWESGEDDNVTVDEEEDDDEAFPVHLTTQDDAVRILTIHKSKGLEFPFVFVPNFSPGKKAEGWKKQRIYHKDGERQVNLDDDDKEIVAQCDDEKIAERRRLMYVAMTRAVYMCRFITKVTRKEFGILKEEGSQDQKELLYRRPELLLKNIESLNCLSLKGEGQKEASSEAAPEAERLNWKAGELYPGWVTTSFSQVSQGTKKREEPSKKEDQTAKKPEETEEESIEEEALYISAPASAREDDENEIEELDNGEGNMDLSERSLKPYAERTVIFQFPGGKRTGSCWHEIFEQLDFTAWKADGESAARESSWQGVLESLEHYGQLGKETRQQRIEAFQEMLMNVCNAPLHFEDATLKLCDIPMARTRREFGFTYRIKDRMEADELRRLLWDYGRIKAPDNWSHAIGKVHLTGFIDLLFQNPQNEKFYIIDWKTNIIGADAETFATEGIASEMERHFYSLQCVLYTLAFVQFYRQWKHSAELATLEGEALRERLAVTCREAMEHFGGCADLFVRGVDALGTKGICYIKPTCELISALDGKLGVWNSLQKEEI